MRIVKTLLKFLQYIFGFFGYMKKTKLNEEKLRANKVARRIGLEYMDTNNY